MGYKSPCEFKVNKQMPCGNHSEFIPCGISAE